MLTGFFFIRVSKTAIFFEISVSETLEQSNIRKCNTLIRIENNESFLILSLFVNESGLTLGGRPPKSFDWVFLYTNVNKRYFLEISVSETSEELGI